MFSLEWVFVLSSGLVPDFSKRIVDHLLLGTVDEELSLKALSFSFLFVSFLVFLN